MGALKTFLDMLTSHLTRNRQLRQVNDSLCLMFQASGRISDGWVA